VNVYGVYIWSTTVVKHKIDIVKELRRIFALLKGLPPDRRLTAPETGVRPGLGGGWAYKSCLLAGSFSRLLVPPKLPNGFLPPLSLTSGFCCATSVRSP